MSNIDSFLQTLGYNRPKLNVQGRSSIVDLIPKSRRCGIYVLHFANGEYYVGLSTDVYRRFREHTITYKDIVFLSFKAVSINDLPHEEEHIIKKLEKADFKLRNKIHTSMTVSSSPFDEIMNSTTQDNWLTNLTFNDLSGERLEDSEHRRKYKERFDLFTTLPFANQAIDFLKLYITRCIPAPQKTELYYWSCSCLPGNSKTLYVRINVKQEVMRIVKLNNALEFTLFMTASDIHKNRGLLKLLTQISDFINYRAFPISQSYKAGGQNQIGIRISGFHNAVKALNDDRFIHAIRTFNLNIMRKTFNLQYHSHCYSLVDVALGK